MYTTVFQEEVFVILEGAKACTGRSYKGECIYTCSNSFTGPQSIKGNAESCLECQKALCALSRWTKVTILVPGHCWLQGKKDVEV